MAEGSDGTCAKKRKLEHIFDLQKRLKKQLDMAVNCLKNGLVNLVVREIEVLDANAKRAMPFSRASIGMTKFESKYPIATIFKRGYAVLNQYLQSDVSNSELLVPKDTNCRKALELLLKFLDEYRDQGAEFLRSRHEVQEWQWTLELAQHVFSKLAINPKYKYDISRSYDESLGCPCPVHETLIGERADTSFGCENGWHGKIDVLMADVPICPAQCEPDLYEPLPSSSASQISDSSIDIEVERSMFNDNDYSQIVAETITFSFLKNKDKCNEDVTLIPSIAINKEGVQCYFYDSVSDVLLQSGYNKLVSRKGKLDVNTIVLIWLTLNYQLFCTGTLQKMKSSGFQKLINLDMYKEQVKTPCRISQDPAPVGISDNVWSIETDVDEIEEFENDIKIPVINQAE